MGCLLLLQHTIVIQTTTTSLKTKSATTITHTDFYLDGIFASPVPLDKTNNEANAKEEDDCEEHPDEPTGGGKGALLRLVPSCYVQVRVHALNIEISF